MLEAARASGCAFDDMPLLPTGAARGGHVHVLQWLQAHGCRVDASGAWPSEASRAGHLEVWIESKQRANVCVQYLSVLINQQYILNSTRYLTIFAYLIIYFCSLIILILLLGSNSMPR